MVFRTGDIITLALYLVGTVGLGVWCAKRARSTEGYFLGSRSIPGWAIGISMLGTAISSVTFLAYPGSAYSGNWSRLVQGLMLPFAAVIGVTYFVTFYRRLRVTSAYEYLEDRFGPWGRSYGCLLFSSMSAYRMGVILYLLSLPLKAMTGWQVEYIIVVTGVLVTFYTVLGGLEAFKGAGMDGTCGDENRSDQQEKDETRDARAHTGYLSKTYRRSRTFAACSVSGSRRKYSW